MASDALMGSGCLQLPLQRQSKQGPIDGASGLNPEGPMEKTTEKILAYNIFENYKVLRKRQGEPVEYSRFTDQPADLQESCFDQARDMGRKASEIGCAIVPAEGCLEETRVRELSMEETELLAEQEHDRWVAERAAKGWTLGRRDAEKKTSPYLVPWDELSEEIKDYDREPISKLIETIESAGLALIRLHRRS